MNRIATNALAELTSEEIVQAVTGKTLVWPMGGIEQHGPHLPLNVDTLIPESLARHLAGRLKGFHLPAQPLSVRSLPQSGGGLSFPGTVYIDGPTFTHYLQRALSSLCRLPFKRLIIINGHYESEACIFEAVDELYTAGVFGDKSVQAMSWWSLVPADWVSAHLADFPGWHAEHAGLTETSLMLYLYPSLVREERPNHPSPPTAGLYQRPLALTGHATRGVLSKTSGSSAALGKLIFDQVINQLLLLQEQSTAQR